MLVIEIPRIPPEGLDLDESLETAAVHLEGDDEFALESGRLRCHVEMVDGTTVHVDGQLIGGLTIECGRCLERYPVSVDQRLDLFFLPRLADRPEDEEEAVDLSDHAVVVGYYDEWSYYYSPNFAGCNVKGVVDLTDFAVLERFSAPMNQITGLLG